jgi:hypothetical protein|nr:hypothetical protein [Candidatus Krumholzibacteria bacterium]
MAAVLCPSHKPLYLNIFPSWKGKQPLRFFLLEKLLEARKASVFPTNGEENDEDVNVFLAGLLTGFLRVREDSLILPGAQCVLDPPAKNLSRGAQADHYLANAHCRLLHLGLMDRGDNLRRRSVPFGMTRPEARQRDMQLGATCYAMAANLLGQGRQVNSGLVAVYSKLAEKFPEYVQVLSVLATRHLGLGAQLSEHQLSRLLDEEYWDHAQAG